MEEVKDDVNVHSKGNYSCKQVLRNASIVFLALAIAITHYNYVSTLFENSTRFSHLSDLEREMLFRTEMGFYYSYYKMMTTDHSILAGVSHIIKDQLVEYPNAVNALNRFNVHPEVLIGAAYRYLEPYLNSTYLTCHMINRGDGLPLVESCVGIGHPMHFYLEVIWGMAGVMAAAVFLYGAELSETIFGGLLSATYYLANHVECTRVQWTPNERENFAAPLLFLQSWCLTMQLRGHRKTSFNLQVSIFILNSLCLLFWQFSQFVFLTQTFTFFIMEQIKVIDLKTLGVFLHSHFCGLHLAVLLLQGNDMLKTSLYTSFFIAVCIYCLFFSYRMKIITKFDVLIEIGLIILRVILVCVAALVIKLVLSDILQVEEDTHIWEILFAKFSKYQNFHTLIYTCSVAFDYLPLSTIGDLCKTLLIPFVVIIMKNAFSYWYKMAKTNSVIKKTVLGELNKPEQSEAKKPVVNEPEKPVIENDENSDDSGIENNSDSKIQTKNEKDPDLKIQTKNEIKDLDVTLANLNLEEEELTLEFVDAAILYNLMQMVIFGVLAALIMRLKLFFTTQMCIISSLMASEKYVQYRRFTLGRCFFWGSCLACLAYHLIENVDKELSHIGEYSNIPQEQLLTWIENETPETAAFAGSLPLMASVMLSTRRPIVAHPHYESKSARDRAYAVYKTYGKFQSHELYLELTKLKATYLVVENTLCYGWSETGCTFEKIWDIDSPQHATKPKLCHTLLTQTTDHFYQVFRNEEFAVFRIHDLSVRYMPRCFDT